MKIKDPLRVRQYIDGFGLRLLRVTSYLQARTQFFYDTFLYLESALPSEIDSEVNDVPPIPSLGTGTRIWARSRLFCWF